MTLAAFQIAMADLAASPALCREVRADPEVLRSRYELTLKEWRQLSAVAGSRGMEANCMLYRANRLAPVALNLPETSAALGPDLNRLISLYWDSEPITNVHFLVEADRFCRFLWMRDDVREAALEPLRREHAVLAARLAYSESLAGAVTDR
jgi:hypothetical protein